MPQSCTSTWHSETKAHRPEVAAAATCRAGTAASISSKVCPMRALIRSTSRSPRVSTRDRYGATQCLTSRGSRTYSVWSPTRTLRVTFTVRVRCTDRPHSRASSSQFFRAHRRQPRRRRGPATNLSKVNGLASDYQAPPTNGISHAAAATPRPRWVVRESIPHMMASTNQAM